MKKDKSFKCLQLDLTLDEFPECMKCEVYKTRKTDCRGCSHWDYDNQRKREFINKLYKKYGR